MVSFLTNASPLFLMWSSVNAQITLPTITGCVGNPAGTATYTTDLSISTGSERIVAGDFWNQLGAIWILSTDSKDIEFSQPGIPGYGAGFGGGGPPAAAESAITLDPSKTAWTLSVPTSSLGGAWDIDFEAAPPSSSSATPSSVAVASSAPRVSFSASADPAPPPSSTGPAVTMVKRYASAQPSHLRIYEESAPKTSTIATFPRRPQKPMPAGVMFRRQAASGKFHLIIKALLPCLGPQPTQTMASGNAVIASECLNNDISTNAAAWTTYGVCVIRQF